MQGQRLILRKFLEMAVLFALLLGIDHGLLAGDAFAEFNPNPYWVPVLVMAVTYGTGTGLISAVVATVIWLSAPHEWLRETDHLGAQLRLSIMPMLWTTAALAIGEVTSSRKASIAEHERRYEGMERNWERMADVVARLARTNRTLQVRIATEQRTVDQAVSAALGLSEIDTAGQIEAVARLIALATESEDFTYYDVRGRQMVARFCGKEAAGRPRDLSLTPLAQQMIASPALLHAGQTEDSELLEPFGVMAMPLQVREGGAVLGMILVHSAKRLRFTKAKVAELRHIAGLLGRLPVLTARGQAAETAPWRLPEGKVA